MEPEPESAWGRMRRRRALLAGLDHLKMAGIGVVMTQTLMGRGFLWVRV